MKIVIFGLTVSSSWGNGHATLWRGLCRALASRGHRVIFFEKDVPYYAANRDLFELHSPGRLRLYSDFGEVRAEAQRELRDADVAIVTSYCPDGRAASALVRDSNAGVKAFYDLDTPVTLGRLANGEEIEYLPEHGLGDFDLVLSYTGGRALEELQSRLNARAVAPLYGSVDTTAHYPAQPEEGYRADLSYLGTYAADRQAALETLFIEPAGRLPQMRFVIGGAQYPAAFPWTANIFFVRHTPPNLHPAFYSSGRATLNVTRQAMAKYGYCPSGRLFEATACGVAVLTDTWDGLDEFFELGSDLLPVHTPEDVVQAMQLTDGELSEIARNGRERTLQQHTAERRAIELETLCERVASAASR